MVLSNFIRKIILLVECHGVVLVPGSSAYEVQKSQDAETFLETAKDSKEKTNAIAMVSPSGPYGSSNIKSRLIAPRLSVDPRDP